MLKPIDELKNKCLECKECRLSDTRTNVVFGVGNTDAEIMFIGEGPGENEDLKGEPFVGRAGKLLDDMLDAVGLSRHKNIYIANIVKCRPPKNRDPLPDEQATCEKWLKAQIEMINPKIIVCVGRIAGAKILERELKITREHGEFTEKDGRLIMAVYHPAALLRDPNKKPDAFADFLKLRDKIKEICNNTDLE